MSCKIGIIAILAFILLLSPTLHSQNIQGPVKVGVASMITPVDAVKYYQEIVDYLSAKLDAPTEMVHRRTYDEMDRMLEKGEVDIAFICSAPYIKNRRNFGVELLVAPQVNGKTFYNSYIIVHKDSTIKRIEDLNGKTFVYVDPKSNTGKLYPEYRITGLGFVPEQFFKKYMYSYSHNKSVELVAKGVVDGAAVESLVFEYMKKKGSPYVKQVRVIERSSDFGIPPVVVSPRVSTYTKEKIREILLGMHNDTDGKRILEEMLIERFVVVPDRNYDSIREMESFVSMLNTPQPDNKSKKGNKTVYFGVIPRDNPRISYEKYQPIIDYLSEVTEYRFELVLKKSYEDTVNSIGHGDIDIALLDPLTYLEARAKYGAVSILKTITDKGEKFYRSVIITKDNSPVNKLSDLKGRNFAFAAIMSTSGNLIPRYLLAGDGIHLQELGKYRNFDYHDSVVKWVLKGEYDAGAVREAVFEKYIQLGLRVLYTSEPIPTGPVAVSPKTPYAVVETVRKALLGMDSSERGREALKRVDPELRGGFVEADDLDYEGIRKMINDVPKTCGMGCHPRIKL